MKIDALFSNALVYDVQSRIDVLKDTTFTLFLDDATDIEVFSNNDEVLSIGNDGAEIAVKADTVGDSKIRFMQGSTIVRELLIVVLTELGRPAVNLGVSAGEPQPK